MLGEQLANLGQLPDIEIEAIWETVVEKVRKSLKEAGDDENDFLIGGVLTLPGLEIYLQNANNNQETLNLHEEDQVDDKALSLFKK